MLSVAFSPVGHLLVAAGAAEQLSAWEVPAVGQPTSVATGSTVNSGPSDTNAFGAIAFRPDGRTFVTADTSGQTYMWSTQTGFGVNPEASLPDATGTSSAAFSPGGHQLVTGDLGGSVVLWTMLAPLLPGGLQLDWPGSSFGQDGTLLAVNAAIRDVNAYGSATLWEIGGPGGPTRIATLPRAWTTAEFLPDGRTLLTMNAHGTELRLWGASARHLVPGATFSAVSGQSVIFALPAPSDGGLLAVTTGDFSSGEAPSRCGTCGTIGTRSCKRRSPYASRWRAPCLSPADCSG
jgi:WD40 repeat protein